MNIPRARRSETDLDHLVPAACQGVFLSADDGIDLDFFRETLGKAAKYIIPPRHFNYSGKLVARRFFNEDYLDHPAVQPMVLSFRRWTSVEAAANSPFDRCLRALVLHHKGLNTKANLYRRRKKRLARLRGHYLKFLRLRQQSHALTPNDHELLQGVTYFLTTIKSQFLTSRIRP